MTTQTSEGICPQCRGELVRVARRIYTRRAGVVPLDRLACPRCDFDLWPACAIEGCVNRVPTGERLCARCREEWEALSAPTVSGGLTIRGEEERAWRFPRWEEWIGIALACGAIWLFVQAFLLIGGAR